MFAAWKVSLRRRKYSPESISHYLTAVRAVYSFAEEAGLMDRIPRLKRVKNEPRRATSGAKALYTREEIVRLLERADLQLKAMVLLGLNCGFGPKDLQDLTWDHIEGNRLTLPRSKTGISQTFLLWPETVGALDELWHHRAELIERMAERNRERSDEGFVFVTKFWRPWSKDAVAEQFRKLCKSAKVKCNGFYRLRHCASTAMALVTTPHVQRRFMRRAQVQQQTTFKSTAKQATRTPSARSSPIRHSGIMRRYEVKSTVMTSNRPLEEWGKLIGDVPAATAILDRFLHHAEIITITGRSYRLKDRAAPPPPTTATTNSKKRTAKTAGIRENGKKA